MTVNITGGRICIDANQIGHLAEKYQITGGTGRFKNASGDLSLKGTLNVILSDASGLPRLLTNTGEFDGSVIGVAERQEAQGQKQ